MSEQKKERWREICELAAVEQDSHKLHELVKELIHVLEAKEQRFQQPSSTADSTTRTVGQFESTRQQ